MYTDCGGAVIRKSYTRRYLRARYHRQQLVNGDDDVHILRAEQALTKLEAALDSLTTAPDALLDAGAYVGTVQTSLKAINDKISQRVLTRRLAVAREKMIEVVQTAMLRVSSPQRC